MRNFKMFTQNILLGLVGVIAFISCKEEELITYKGENNLYFTKAVVVPPNSAIAVQTHLSELLFAYTNVVDTAYTLEVSATGVPSNVDRPFKVSVSPTSTATPGKHYDPLPDYFIMPAGAVSTLISVVLHKTEDLADSVVFLDLQLEPYGDFTTNLRWGLTNNNYVVSYVTHIIATTDIVLRPKYWGDGYLGAFSRKKILMLCEFFNVTLSDFADETITTANVQASYGTQFARYLKGEADAGRTVYEDDGVTPMAMGSSL